LFSPVVRDVSELFSELQKSPFRRKFRLRDRELAYLYRKGLRQVMKEGSEFVEARLAPASPRNDGKQTPWGNHPIFVGQHATATCCRGCLEKWHGIPRGSSLSAEEKEHVLRVLRSWLQQFWSRGSDQSGSPAQ